MVSLPFTNRSWSGEDAADKASMFLSCPRVFQVRFDDAAIVGALPIGTDVLIAETASPRPRSAFAKFLPQVDGIHTRSEITGTYHDLIRVQP